MDINGSKTLSPLGQPVKADEGRVLPVAGGKALPGSSTAMGAATSDSAPLSAQPARKSVDLEDLKLSEETVDRMNDMLREKARELEFSVDDASGRTIVRVIHSESGEVIRQLPPEVVLRFANAFTDGAASLVEDFA